MGKLVRYDKWTYVDGDYEAVESVQSFVDDAINGGVSFGDEVADMKSAIEVNSGITSRLLQWLCDNDKMAANELKEIVGCYKEIEFVENEDD